MNDFDLGFKKRDLYNMNKKYLEGQIGEKKKLSTLNKLI